MAITYAAGPGTLITSHAMNETCINQTDQIGNNTVVVSDDIDTAGNGQIGTKYPDYTGRLVIINLGGTEQRRMCIASAAIGTPTVTNSWLLTVHEDWDTNPVATTDTIHVAYDVDDIETGGASGGIGLGGKTGLYELTNTLTIQSTGGLQNSFGQGLETDDGGNNIQVFINSGGYFYSGYEAGGLAVNSGLFTFYNNTATEPSWQWQSGSKGYFYGAVLWSQLVTQQWEHANGAGGEFYECKFISLSNELHLYDALMRNCSVSGRGATTEIVRVDAGTDINGLVLSNVDTLDTVADTTTETIELWNILFSGVTDLINVRNNKTWNMIDPIWLATTYTDFTWVGSTANAVNDRTSITAIVQEADGTLLQNALVIVYEGTILDDLVLELVSDSAGFAQDSFIYKAHVTNSATTTYGGHALRVDKWLYTPFVATQSSTDKFDSSVTLITDDNIVQTTQATALTAGSGITWNDETNPSSIIAFTGGSGTLAVGNTVTASPSGADGVVTQILSGDSTAGEIHLKTRDAVAFATSDTLSNGAGWTANYTTASQQDFSIWIDGNNLSLQVIYDYLAALSSETTLSATGELLHEWGREDNGRALYKSGNDFFTERSLTPNEGVIIIDYGAGAVTYFTDDSGVTWTPPTSVTITVTVKDTAGDPINLAQVGIYTPSTGTTGRTELMNKDTNASGIATESYTGTVPISVEVRVRKASAGATKYINYSSLQQISASGLTLAVTMREDPNNNALT